uniref:U-stichotoxin-Hau3a n=1 Tax=Heteractis aurora TaxID=478399 RepID=NA3A_HETAU|nr:peptide toxin [Heteractis aurora]
MNHLIILVVAAVFLGMASAEDVFHKRFTVSCLCASDGPSVHGNKLTGTVAVGGCNPGWHKCNTEHNVLYECCKKN